MFHKTGHIFRNKRKIARYYHRSGCSLQVLCIVSQLSNLCKMLTLQCESLTSSSAMESGSSPSWYGCDGDGCDAMLFGLAGTEHFELLDSVTHKFFSRFGRRPNRDATHASMPALTVWLPQNILHYKSTNNYTISPSLSNRITSQ